MVNVRPEPERPPLPPPRTYDPLRIGATAAVKAATMLVQTGKKQRAFDH